MEKKHRNHNRITKLTAALLMAVLVIITACGCTDSGAEKKTAEDLEAMRYVQLDGDTEKEISSLLSDRGREYFELFLAKAGEFEYEIIDSDKTGSGDAQTAKITVRIRTYDFAGEYLKTWTDFLEESASEKYDDAVLYEKLFRNLSSIKQKDYLADVVITCQTDAEGNWTTDAKSSPELLDAILGGMLGEIAGLAGTSK